MLKTTSDLIAGELISTSKSSITKVIGNSNSKIDKAIIKTNIVGKVNIRTFQLETAKS